MNRDRGIKGSRAPGRAGAALGAFFRTFSLFHVITALALGAEPSVPPLALRVAKVVACDDANTVLNDAVVLVRDGKIERLGPAADVPVPDGYRVIELAEEWLLPGIVEAHNHSCAGGWGDLNDMVYQTNPGLDSRPIPRPNNDWVKRARMGGVTTALLLPGSGTNISGFGTIVSTGGRTPDEMIMVTPGSLKIAQAGNPEWYFGGNGRSFMNWNTRQTIEKARAYCESWAEYERQRAQPPAGEAPGRGAVVRTSASAAPPPLPTGAGPDGARQVPVPPPFDPIWHNFRGLFRGEYPATVHTQIYQVELATLDMFATKFDLWTVTEHSCFDAWRVGALARELESKAAAAGNPHGLWTIQGPRQYHFDRTARRMVGNANGWWKNGIRRLGINTDAPVVPQEELTYQAAMACWYGWLPYPATQAITCITAKSIGVYDRVGSVEPGKQADLSVWTGDPLDPRSACLLTIVRGRIEYDGRTGLRRF